MGGRRRGAGRAPAAANPLPVVSIDAVDTLSSAIARLKGKTIRIATPQQFAKAVEGIVRHSHSW